MGHKTAVAFRALFLIGLAASFLMAGQVKAEEAVFESSLVCKECHKDNYRNWKRSLHALSFTNPIFQTAYRKAYTETKGEAKKLCLGCHAPTVRVTGDFDAELPITKEGITCDFCHSVEMVKIGKDGNELVLKPGGPKRSVLKKAESPHHETEYNADFASARLCGACHDSRNRHGIHVNATYSEWRQSPYAQKGIHCQRCHMAEIPGRTAKEGGRDKIHDHSLSHNLLSMKDAVTVEVKSAKRIQKKLEADVEIVNARVGHSIPTGPPARELVLEMRTIDRNGRTIETKKKVFKRVVVDKEGAELFSDGDVFIHGAKIVKDNRIRPAEKRLVRFIFGSRLGSVNRVEAELYFLYHPVITQTSESVIPLFSADALVE